MDERLLTRLRGAGFDGELIGSLESSDAAFALSDASLAFVDAAGARQVALREINRIHSDREGVLRVETVAGTAITASLLGFDPSGVQGFFNEVRIATNTAKQLPQAPHATPVTQGPWKSGWSSSPNVAPVSQPPLDGVDADSTVTTPLSTSAQSVGGSTPRVTPTTPPAAAAQPVSLAATPEAPASQPMPEAPQRTPPAPTPTTPPPASPSDPEERVTVLPQTGPASPDATPASAPTPPSRPAPKPVVISTAPRYSPEAEAPRSAPAKPAPTEARKPPQPTKAAAPAATPRPETSPPVPATPARETPAPRAPVQAAGLLALADSVERLTGTLRLLALAMGIAAILIGILRFRDGDTVTGLWILGSGVIAAFALLVFAQVARLMVGIARQMNPNS